MSDKEMKPEKETIDNETTDNEMNDNEPSSNKPMINETVNGSSKGSTMAAPKRNSTWVLGTLLLIAAIVIVWLVAFDKDQSGQSATVTKVNGEAITKDMLYDRLPGEYTSSLIDQAVQDVLINQEAEKANITITDEEIKAAVDEQIDRINQQFPPDQLNAILAQQGLTMEGLVEDIEKNMPRNLKLEKLLGSEIEVTDEEAETFFNENKASFNTPKRVRASHILVETKELAQTILDELNNGADFAELSTEHSKDTVAKANGGDLDFFTKEAMVPAFSEAAFSMEIGEISGIVETEHGFHIVKVTDIQEAKEYTFEEKKEEVKDILFDQKLQPVAGEFLTKIKEEATIQ